MESYQVLGKPVAVYDFPGIGRVSVNEFDDGNKEKFSGNFGVHFVKDGKTICSSSISSVEDALGKMAESLRNDSRLPASVRDGIHIGDLERYKVQTDEVKADEVVTTSTE